jgi:hypothetical protein
VTQRGPYITLEPTFPDDFDAVREAGLQRGLVFDGHQMRFFYLGGDMDEPVDRCGY